MFCSKCGKEINDNIEVCRYCGARTNINGNNNGNDSLNHLMNNIDTIDVDENGDFVTVPIQGDIDALATEPLPENGVFDTVPIQENVDVLATEPLPENERKNIVAQSDKPVATPTFEKVNKEAKPVSGKSNTPLIVGIIVGVIGIIAAIIAIAVLFIYMPGNSTGNNGEEPQNQSEDYIIGADDENYVEEQTDSNGETVPVTETTKKANSDDKEKTETTETTTERTTTQQAVVPSGPMTKTEFISFLNTETAKASQGSYRVVRTGYLTRSVDAGSSTDTLNKIIQMVDLNASLDSVFGGFLGIDVDVGTNVTEGRTNNCDSKYLLKATKLTSSDISNYSVNGDEYTLVLKNCTNPGSYSALAHATNDYLSVAQFSQNIASMTTLIKVEEGTQLNYSNIILKITVRDGVLKSYEYSYILDSKMKMKAGMSITATCAGKIYGKYSYFNY